MARRNSSAPIAMGGVFAALGVVIMCMGGLIPVATFICPMLCMMLLAMVVRTCDSRVGWAWYGAVAILSLLLGPDKEAAAVFLFLGYYPILKPKMDALPLRWLWKGLLFNAAILAMYAMLLHLLGMKEIAEDYAELGTVLTIVMLIMGNITFFMLDFLLGRRFPVRGKGRSNG